MSSTSPRYPPPGGYPPRPPTIDDLEARAVSHWQDNRIHITSLWKAADNWRNRGQTYEEQQDLQSAFVAYTSARSLVLEVIPAHPDYNKAFNEEQKSSLAQNGERILADLAGVKEKLLKQQEEWDRKYGGAAQPSEGDHALTTTLLSLQMNGSQGGLDDSAQINSPQEQQHQPHDEEAMWRQQTEDITPQTVEEDAAQQAAGVPSPTENGASSASLPDSKQYKTRAFVTGTVTLC
ncbi:hypothetical protein ARMSODRAFT_119769 [Armillaria solidipes]|uniref:USP8 dimerisation domain-containing protein n=1 Tax=Armillaria solidipes TaxID=1076256 RepID=A0A2H3AHW2_9AGAR|nr:hypothetical protein ARMSODRAFT_119769 [Armillaria solidipes]